MPYYNDQKNRILQAFVGRIAEAAYTPIGDLTVAAWATKEPVSYADRCSGNELALEPGDKWGDLFDCAWFRFTATVPDAAADSDLVLLIDVNGEACVVDEAGNPVQGLTNVSSGYDLSLGMPGKRVVPLGSVAPGEPIELWADAGCNDLFGNLRGNGCLKEARIAIRNPNLHALQYDYEVLHDLMLQLPEESPRRQRIFAALSEVVVLLRDMTDDEAASAREILAPELAKHGGDSSLTISAVGHAHIDLAWLWPIRETIRKGARTFSTVLRSMEQYPDYIFGASQPQLFQWMKDHYPTVYDEIRARIEEGRFEVQGAMWVESDTNVPSGESLVRQLLHGKRFYRDEFGKEIDNLWLPDVFGYSAALPQILKKAGVDTFMTQKMSWSIVNRFPHHTFQWQGIDGSQVLAHMLPEETYNSSAAPRAIAKTATGFADKTVSDRCLLLFGIGDGGGGPGEEHLERLGRERNLDGLVPVVQESGKAFFDRIVDGDDYPTWVGELYLERHQGTYTTQARSKRYNRKLEFALREAEWAASLGASDYPTDQLDEIWKEVLLYQFHDILPGSSITRVYDESLERYARLTEQTDALIAQADAALVADIDTGDMQQPVVVTNSLSWGRAEYVLTDAGWACVTLPSMGYVTIDTADLPPVSAPDATPNSIENDLVRAAFADDGSVRSVFDKVAQREVILGGEAGNRLAVYDDPGDAWDIPMDYADRPPKHFALVSSEVIIDGPKAGVRQTYKFGDSTLVQDAILTTGSARLDFVTRADWRESAKMLRTSFPLAVHASEATCEIQFGSIKRPTHRNTTWDVARYEVCAQKWVDLSERGYGVALLNDCKYGHKLLDTTLDIDLLRSPHHPDPMADRAEHEFTYSLLPHCGDHVDGGVVREGFELNVPLRVHTASGGGDRPATASLVSVDAPNVVIDTVKKAEDSGDLILRLYEAHGASARAAVSFGFPIESASLVDLMEENDQPVDVAGGGVQVALSPFEIQTLKVRRSG